MRTSRMAALTSTLVAVAFVLSGEVSAYYEHTKHPVEELNFIQDSQPDWWDAVHMQLGSRRAKRTGLGGGPSLSIVNPLDVLRQRLLLEIARRRLRQSEEKIHANREWLKTIGKRSADASQLDGEGGTTMVWSSKLLRGYFQPHLLSASPSL